MAIWNSVGPYILFVIGLVFLIKGGDWFVDGATGIAHRFHVPELLIGATIVSIGTTLPEVMVSATSALQGIGDMAYGNAVGSVICNTTLIAALTIAVRPSDVDKKSLKLPMIFFFIAAALFMGVAYFRGSFDRLTGIMLLCLFVVYIVISTLQMKKHPELAAEDAEEKDEGEEKPLWKNLVLLVVGAALIAVGADLLVDNGTIIAERFGVPDTVIALTFVALGTSLPELVTAITSLAKGHSALSLGNVIGANLFNLVLVMGTASTLAPFKVPTSSTIGGLDASKVLELPLMVTVMLILCLPAALRGKLKRSQGIVLLCIYVAFTIIQFTVCKAV